MDLPVKFPSETEVILDEVARSRALSPRDRVRAYRGFLISSSRIASKLPKAEWARQYDEEQELIAQRNIREFITRHGY